MIEYSSGTEPSCLFRYHLPGERSSMKGKNCSEQCGNSCRKSMRRPASMIDVTTSASGYGKLNVTRFVSVAVRSALAL